MKRRDFNALLGLGAFCNSFIPAFAESKVPLKKNVVFISTNYGFLTERFQAKSDSLNSPYLNFYNKVKNKCTLFQGIEQKEMGGGHRSHHSIFTAQSKFNKITPPFVSLDQLIASRVAQTTRHKFVALSTGKSSQTCWSLSGQNIPPLTTYDDAFHYLFKQKIETNHLIQHKFFLNQFQNSKLSTTHSAHYKQAINDMVQEMDSNIYWSQKDLPKIEDKFNSSKNEFMNLEGFLSLIHESLKQKQARVFNFNIGHGGTVELDGVKEGYHKLTHNGKDPDMKKQLIKIEEFQLQHLSRFLENLEADHLLDDTVVVVTGAFGNSNSHSTHDLPLLVFGGGMKHQGLVQCKHKNGSQIYKLSDLYVSILNHIGLDNIDSFAGYRGNLNHKLA